MSVRAGVMQRRGAEAVSHIQFGMKFLNQQPNNSHFAASRGAGVMEEGPSAAVTGVYVNGTLLYSFLQNGEILSDAKRS